jgi:hypothetical protein
VQFNLSVSKARNAISAAKSTANSIANGTANRNATILIHWSACHFQTQTKWLLLQTKGLGQGTIIHVETPQ